MNDVGTLNINECSPTNKDVTVTYVPQTFVTSYEYTIYKDSKEYKTIKVNNNKSSNIVLDETGVYQIKITTLSLYGSSTYTTKYYKIDKEAPVIEVQNEKVVLSLAEDYDPLTNIRAYDNVDGNIKNNVKTNIDSINLNFFGKKKLTYTVTDQAGNMASKDIILDVSLDGYLLSFNQILLIIILSIILVGLIILSRINKLEKRFIDFTVKPLKDKTVSLFDSITIFVRKIVNRLSRRVIKFEILKKSSKRYEKYIDAFFDVEYKAIDFVSLKLLTSFIFLISSIIVQTLRFKVINIYEIFIPVIFGYYLLDIIYAYKYYKYRKKIEKDLLQAIIIMNNSFKSGRSITQAIKIVAEQLDGAISDEFKKMSLELSFGLELEVVFRRFAERIKLEEAMYLTSSLSVLNKTGGNIIKVFTSIEKTLFNRQKLNLELKSLTGASKIIMYALMVMPILFIMIISFINKDYFAPLFTNVIGFIIIGIIAVLYVTYIIIVRKIMKVRM